MENFARVKNKFWVESEVALWKAKRMVLDWEIEDYELIKVESSKNTEEPESQVAFERWLKSKK